MSGLRELVEMVPDNILPDYEKFVVSYKSPHWTTTDHFVTNRDGIAMLLEAFHSQMLKFTSEVEAVVFFQEALVTEGEEVIGIDGFPLVEIRTNDDSDFGWTIEHLI